MKAPAPLSHPFLTLLKETVEDEGNQRKAAKIIYWRHRVTLPVPQGVHHETVPSDIAFAVKPSYFNVDKEKIRRILAGLHVPSPAELQRITENYGLPPESPQARKLLELGEDYRRCCEQTQAIVVPSANHHRPAPKQKPHADQIYSPLAQALRELRQSRIMLKGFTIVPRDSDRTRKEKGKSVSIETTALLAQLPTGSVGGLETDRLRMESGRWNDLIVPILDVLKATEAERDKIHELFQRQIASAGISRR